MRLRRDFYSKHSDKLPANPEDRGEVTDKCIYSFDETICLSLEYSSGSAEEAKDEQGKEGHSEEVSSRRFLRCPAAVTVGLLKRLIRGKYGLDSDHSLDILYGDSFLCDEYSLVDLAYIYNWRRKGPMRLKYRIYQRIIRNIPLVNGNSVTKDEVKQDVGDEAAGSEQPAIRQKEQEADVKMEELDEEPLKEVRLEISESGIMSILNVDVTTESTTVLSSGKASDDPRPPEEELTIAPPPPLPTVTDAPVPVEAHSPRPRDLKTSISEATPALPSVSDPVAVASTEAATMNPLTVTTAASVLSSTTASVVSVVTGTPTTATATTATAATTTSNAAPSTSTSSAQGAGSKPAADQSKKLMLPAPAYKTLKVPPRMWNPSVSRAAIKRPPVSMASGCTNNNDPPPLTPTPAKRASSQSTTSSPSKASRFFKGLHVFYTNVILQNQCYVFSEFVLYFLFNKC